MTEEKKRGRGERGLGKVTPKKLARDMKRDMENLLEQNPTVEDFKGLLKIGFHTSTAFLVNCVLGDESIEGLSATNRVSAAKEVRDMALSLLSKEELMGLEEEAEKEAEALTDEQEKNQSLSWELPRYDSTKAELQ